MRTERCEQTTQQGHAWPTKAKGKHSAFRRTSPFRPQEVLHARRALTSTEKFVYLCSFNSRANTGLISRCSVKILTQARHRMLNVPQSNLPEGHTMQSRHNHAVSTRGDATLKKPQDRMHPCLKTTPSAPFQLCTKKPATVLPTPVVLTTWPSAPYARFPSSPCS